MGHFLFISGPELVIIILVVLVLFGANKMPELARGLGKGMREFRKAADDIKRELEDSASDVRKDMDEFRDDVNKTLKP